jgi:hypothetical protein
MATFESSSKQKTKIIGVYVLKICDGKLELVEEKQGTGFGPIGGRMSYMDERDGVGLRGVLAREYVAETGSLLSRDIHLTYIGVFYDETEKYLYENNIYILMNDTPLTRRQIKCFEIRDVLNSSNTDIKFRHWFKNLVTNDIIRNELVGISVRNGIRDMGLKFITSVWYVYIFPEHNPGIDHIYRIGIDTQETEEGMRIVYTPKRVTWKIVESDVSKNGVGIKSALLVPCCLDQIRNQRVDTNIFDLVDTLPKEEGIDNENWLMFPLHEYYAVGA